MGSRGSLFVVVNTLHSVLGTVILTQLRESNQLAASLSCFIDPVYCPTNRLLEVEPARLSIDCCGLVLLENRNHIEMLIIFPRVFALKFVV